MVGVEPPRGPGTALRIKGSRGQRAIEAPEAENHSAFKCPTDTAHLLHSLYFALCESRAPSVTDPLQPGKKTRPICINFENNLGQKWGGEHVHPVATPLPCGHAPALSACGVARGLIGHCNICYSFSYVGRYEHVFSIKFICSHF